MSARVAAVALRRFRMGDGAAVSFYRKMGYAFKNGITEADEFGVVRLEKRRKT